MSTRLILAGVLTLGTVHLMGCGNGYSPSTAAKNVADEAPKMDIRPAAMSVAPGETAEPFGTVTESYEHAPESRMLSVNEQPLSTFSIDVDTASYSNVRRFLKQKRLPPPEAVRIEELINYFSYDDPPADGETPFSVNVEVAGCPWNSAHRLARIGLKGKTVTARERPASNIVFLIDVSGSMNHANKLPLVKQSIGLLVEQLNKSDRIAIVVYAGAAGLVLPSTSAENKGQILSAIDRLQPSGSTNGALGIGLAYDVARKNFIPRGTNRVVLCTDGDFNVGVTGPQELQHLIEDQAKSNVFLTVLGFGMGNLKDATMERLADHGNGNYGYIDNIAEARKLFVEQLAGTLITIAKDVKIQVEFNPMQVAAYRLIGYENRRLANRDFHDDTKDAGEIGAGHSVTALYELVPVGADSSLASAADPLRYQPASVRDTESANDGTTNTSNELLAVRLRYKEPEGQKSRLQQVAVVDRGTVFENASANLRFAAAVAQFGMMLTNSRFCGDSTFDKIAETAHHAVANDFGGHRKEFVELVELARDLTTQQRFLSRTDGE